MQITKATIRTTEKYVLIDATVDGKFRDGFVLYDGNTRDHEDAALIYLVNSVKLSISAIDFVDDRVPTTNGYDVKEYDDTIDVPRPAVDLPELSRFFA